MRWTIGMGLALALAGGLPTGAQDRAGEALLAEKCGGCHSKTDDGLSRIAGQRKTPEGWLMTIVRMRIAHDVELTPEEQSALVFHLADDQGLAPAEAAPFRYALERDPSAIETTGEPLASMCGRCHTFARVGLQRRTPEEWVEHMHFHVGQFPTVEYQALGRDRDWFRLAKDEIAPMLAEAYPLKTPEWTDWKDAEWPDPQGDWVVLTNIPGKGDAYGRLTVAGESSAYEVTGELRLEDDTPFEVSGSMNLYTGYEWRADLDIGGQRYRQVLALSEDGAKLEGRQFRRNADSLGARLTGVRADAPAMILGTVPANGDLEVTRVQVVGTGLGEMRADGGIVDAITPNAFGSHVEISSDEDAVVTLHAGDAEGRFVFFSGADRISVEPAFTIARVGGGSEVGPAPVPAEFRAVAWQNGPDALPDTEDDIRIGTVPATWSVTGFNEIAAELDDAAFAGSMGEDGIFTPAVAGPNPERPFSTNNAGDLTVTGTAQGLTGTAHLIVTVQRWNDPPIR